MDQRMFICRCGCSSNEYHGPSAICVCLSLRAADAAEPHAMTLLATCFRRGWGVPRDFEKAVELYQAAASLGSALAMGQLGVCFEKARFIYKGGVGRACALIPHDALYSDSFSGFLS